MMVSEACDCWLFAVGLQREHSIPLATEAVIKPPARVSQRGYGSNTRASAAAVAPFLPSERWQTIRLPNEKTSTAGN